MEQQLAAHIAELEKKYAQGKWLSFNHISELYLHEYYAKKSDIQLAEDAMNQLYFSVAKQYEEADDMENALLTYDKAVSWNPVDLDAQFARIALLKKSGEIEGVREQTLALYPYLCTRAMMAHFYRNLGFYYIETYQPELAAMLYEYSKLFAQSEQADQELDYLKNALNKEFPEHEVSEIQARLRENGIPVFASSTTVGLLYEVGKSEEGKQHMQEAADCYLMVYDLTQDEEVQERLRRIGS